MAINMTRLKFLLPRDRTPLVKTLSWMTLCAVLDGVAGLMLVPLILSLIHI